MLSEHETVLGHKFPPSLRTARDMSVPRFNPMQNDEAIARSLQFQEQESESARREQEERDARLAASLAVPAGSGAIPHAVAAPLPAQNPFASSPVRAGLQCREGCALTPFSASPHQRVQCDRCGQRIAAGRQTLSCLAHDYDVCETCAAAPPAPQIVQGRVLPPQGAVQGTIVHRASGRGIVGERAVAGLLASTVGWSWSSVALEMPPRWR